MQLSTATADQPSPAHHLATYIWRNLTLPQQRHLSAFQRSNGAWHSLTALGFYTPQKAPTDLAIAVLHYTGQAVPGLTKALRQHWLDTYNIELSKLGS